MVDADRGLETARSRGPMTHSTVAVTANVLNKLPATQASAALRDLLSHDPDLVALQEWGPRRRALLRAQPGYLWVPPVYGGNVVGARAERFRLLGSRLHHLGGWGVPDPGSRPVRLLPPRVATVAVLRDLELGRVVAVIGFHLVPGTRHRGEYRQDRPRLARRHRAEVRRLESLVADEVEDAAAVFALGDSNFHGLRLPPLASAWVGRDDHPGTLGSHRKIDDVFGPGPAIEVKLLTNASDHRAVLAVRADDA